MELTRRELMKLVGVSGASAAVGAWGASTIFSFPDEFFERVVDGPRIETWKNSICSLCPGGCGIRVRLIDDVPVRILGNPQDPINRGAVCPMAEAGIEALFHRDRIRVPLKLTGRRGEGQWQATSWEEALTSLSERLKGLRDDGTPERLAILTAEGNESIDYLGSRFMKAFGSPNLVSLSEAQVSALPIRLTQGLQRNPVYDLQNADFVLNFGDDLLDDSSSPVRFNQLYAQLRERKAQGSQIVHFSSYMSRTAANAGQWIPVELGTMGALALGIAHVIVKDGTFDDRFIHLHTSGFYDWKDAAEMNHRGFKTLVLEAYYPERVREYTGVPAHRIVEIAREFSAAKSAVAIPGKEAFFSTNGLYTGWAIHCLNALRGNLDKTGGVLFPELITPPQPEIEVDTTARKGLDKPRLGFQSSPHFTLKVDSLNGFAGELAGSVDTLFIHRINPLFESTDRAKFLSALQEVPFIVSCSSFLDDTAVYADLVLPEPVFLERWEASLNNPAVEFRHFGVQQPVMQPLYETKHFGDLLLEIGKRLGSPVEESLPWDGYEDYLKSQAQAIFATGEGTIVSDSVEYGWIESLKERGWQAFDYSTSEEFWDVLLERGGWWDPTYPEPDPKRILKTASGKFEFYSRLFRQETEELLARLGVEQGESRNLNLTWKIDAHGDEVYMPHFEAPRFHRGEIDFPYNFLTYQRLTNMNREGAFLSLVQEMSGLYSREYWQSWVEINPETARRFEIDEGDFVAVTSPQGRLVVKAKLCPTVMPHVIVMPRGLGHRTPGKSTGVNPYQILVADEDLISGFPSLISTKVRIEKLKTGEKL